MHGAAEDIADQGVDARHEAAGEAWLQRWYGAEVTEPVRLHVAAKRYLCAVDPTYLSKLSPASVQSLALQGGPFGQEEVQEFEANPHYAAAVSLRRWDDEAKIAGPGSAWPRTLSRAAGNDGAGLARMKYGEEMGRDARWRRTTYSPMLC